MSYSDPTHGIYEMTTEGFNRPIETEWEVAPRPPVGVTRRRRVSRRESDSRYVVLKCQTIREVVA